MKATIVITWDDADVYFLVINRETGSEYYRCSTNDFGTGRFFDDYKEDEIIKKLVDDFCIDEYTLIYW